MDHPSKTQVTFLNPTTLAHDDVTDVNTYDITDDKP